MSEQYENNLDPTPQSEVLAARSVEERMKRPVSVKWALVMMLGSVICISILEAQVFGEYGWRLWTDHPLATAEDVSRIAACFALLFGGRKPWVFWLTVMQLSLHLINFGKSIIWGLPAIPANDMASQISFFLVGVLLCYHYYRFTFCGPSRRYFHVARE